MATPVGGQRSHFILASLWAEVATNLTALGWGTETAGHKALQQARDGLPKTEAISANLISLETDRTTSSDYELGSNFSEHRRVYYFDILAESRVVAEHICGDIKDILEGRMPAIGRTRAHIPVTQWNLVSTQDNYLSVGTNGALVSPEGFVTLGDTASDGLFVVLGPGDTVFTYAQVESVDVDPLIEDPSIKHRQNYWTIRVILTDYYGNADDV